MSLDITRQVLHLNRFFMEKYLDKLSLDETEHEKLDRLHFLHDLAEECLNKLKNEADKLAENTYSRAVPEDTPRVRVQNALDVFYNGHPHEQKLADRLMVGRAAQLLHGFVW